MWTGSARICCCWRWMPAGVICKQTRFLITRWRITQTGRLAEARQRLDLIACSAGPVDLSQAAYAGLACAIGLDQLLYPGRRRRAERDRLRDIAAGHWITTPAKASAPDAGSPDAGSGAGRAASDAATLAAIRAATDAVASAAAAAARAVVVPASGGGGMPG